jgi:hypothetical protein
MPFETMLRALVAKGYFPAELPPAFTTETFGEHIIDILEDWRKSGVYEVKPAGKTPKTKLPKRNSHTYKLQDADVELISTPKRRFERRNLSVVHPLSQALLSFELTKNWPSIQKWLTNQLYSLYSIRIDGKSSRAIKSLNFSLHRAKKDFIEAVADWLVITDISRFYPTIYTHSIPWAAYGKEKVKANLALYQGSLADRIDSLVRAGNRNQTIGIPIGPETS